MVQTHVAEYELYCFAQSGNSYRCALMLNLIGADWKPTWVDFFEKGVQRSVEYRSQVNEMGEIPVLVHGEKKLSQSGVILSYLAKCSGKFLPQGEEEEFEALRWLLFDNQKVNGYLAPYRFLRTLAKQKGDPAVLTFLKGRIDNALGIVDQRLSTRATHARRSLVGGLHVLSSRRIRVRHRPGTQTHRGMVGADQGFARLETSV
jgi:glutathione S-transferase